MNILILNYEFPPLGGGASPVSFEISKRLAQQGHRVDVITMSYKNLPSYEIIEGVHIYRVKSIRSRKDICKTHEMLSYIISAKFFLNKHLKNKSYDICHCHFLIPTGILALWIKKKFGIEYVITAHGSDVPGYNSDRFLFLHYFTKPLLRVICNNAKSICSSSKYLIKLIHQNIGKYNIKHIPNGIDPTPYLLKNNEQKEQIILSTGRLLKRKGFDTLIKAVRAISFPLQVHIVGDGPYKKELIKLAKHSKTKIIFHGWVEKDSSKLINLYKKAMIFSLVSSKENASIALLEAMASKCVIITSNTSGCPETINDSGFTIKPGDYIKLRTILQNLTFDKTLVEAYSQRSFQRVNEYYLWDTIIKKYLKEFEK